MQKAEAEVAKDNETGGIGPENNREYLGSFSATGVNIHPPGAVADPSKGKPAISMSYDRIDFHSHPSGTKRITLPNGKLQHFGTSGPLDKI